MREGREAEIRSGNGELGSYCENLPGLWEFNETCLWL